MADVTNAVAGHSAEITNQVHWFWGKLSWDIFPFYDPLILGTFIVTILLGVSVVGFVTYKRLWGYLWTEWFTSVDHKKIGIMYMILATVMLIRGFSDAILMRIHQALASAGILEFLPAYHYDQVFTAHGVIMIFFVAMPFITGFMNYIMPL
ncbi:MAG: cbb3-type cytochrome c oxidase subunit I, partial [Alphaproteobacteria bacterium]|nr:cbb3-type cytochrome c oxidase subunit I [Alphaproteobacteria bacterium]